MPGMLGVINSHHTDYDEQLLSESIDLLSLGKTKTINFQGGFVSVSSLRRTPLKGKRWIKQGDKIFCFSGDLVGFPELPWHDIIDIITKAKYKKFKDYEGVFAITCIDKKNKRVVIVSDRRSQHPIFYRKINSKFIFSTDLSTFCRLKESPVFNICWLYEFFFFNFPVSQTTFLKNVFRMPPASVLSYDSLNDSISVTQYADVFQAKSNLLEGTNAFELAVSTFKENIEQYYQGETDIACALTDGWDGRTMLSLAPDIDKVTSYTYGVPGCPDVVGASKTAKLARAKHQNIYFNNQFINNLPEYIIKTVYLSSGLQSILRSTLLFAYERLTNYGQIFPLIISGIALDELFRGNHASPNPISYDIEKIFQEGFNDLRQTFWSKVFKKNYSDFEKYIISKLEHLYKTFGEFTSPEHHLLFKMYLQGPQYFSGELKIANQFSTVRVPAWNSDIIDLAFSIKESALSFSAFTGLKRSGQSVVQLQSYILKKLSPRFANIQVRNTRPDIALNHRLIYNFYTLLSVIRKKISLSFKKPPPLEDWNSWLNVRHERFVDSLVFAKDSLIKQYIAKSFIDKIKTNRDTHWIGKLITAEVILRLIEKKWTTTEIIETKI